MSDSKEVLAHNLLRDIRLAQLKFSEQKPSHITELSVLLRFLSEKLQEQRVEQAVELI